MNRQRPHPFDLVLGHVETSRLREVREAAGHAAGIDRFLAAGPAVELLRELRPDTGLDAAVDEFVALIHAAVRFDEDGRRTLSLDGEATRVLVDRSVTAAARRSPGSVWYIQLEPRRVWAQLDDTVPHEPLDGFFVVGIDEATLRVVGCFGVLPGRPGFTVVALDGPPPEEPLREAGTAFLPTMPGGDAARLVEIATPSELLALGWNAVELAEER